MLSVENDHVICQSSPHFQDVFEVVKSMTALDRGLDGVHALVEEVGSAEDCGRNLESEGEGAPGGDSDGAAAGDEKSIII